MLFAPLCASGPLLRRHEPGLLVDQSMAGSWWRCCHLLPLRRILLRVSIRQGYADAP